MAPTEPARGGVAGGGRDARTSEAAGRLLGQRAGRGRSRGVAAGEDRSELLCAGTGHRGPPPRLRTARMLVGVCSTAGLQGWSAAARLVGSSTAGRRVLVGAIVVAARRRRPRAGRWFSMGLSNCLAPCW
eukprot:scaffold31848_cov69-Phaeocystis_antarctica.AAC.2